MNRAQLQLVCEVVDAFYTESGRITPPGELLVYDPFLSDFGVPNNSPRGSYLVFLYKSDPFSNLQGELFGHQTI